MASLKDLRRRIRSVSQTQKITDAMKMISAVRFRKAQQSLVYGRQYYHHTCAAITKLLKQEHISLDLPSLQTGHPQAQDIYFIVITSDKGLCGGYSHSVIKMAHQLIQKCMIGQRKKVKILAVGKKGRDQLHRIYPDVKGYQLEGPADHQILRVVDDLFNDIKQADSQGSLSSLWGCYTHFHSALKQEPVVKQLIPFDHDAHEKDVPGYCGFEPNIQQAIQLLTDHYLKASLGYMILDSQASEHGARMTAMDNASRNASDMLGDLRLSYNSTRQSLITKELIEIISGASAL